MLRRKKKRADEPTLVDRLQASRCGRIAVLGLHSGAGCRTVLQQVAFDCARRGVPIGITRAPRAVADEVETSPPLVLPEGVLVATATGPDQAVGALVLLEMTDCETACGPVGLYRVTREGPISIHGPDDPESIGGILDHLQRRSGGAALIDGEWERRGFAAPGVTDGIVLVAGTGYSRTPEHSAAAVRYMIDTLTVEACERDASEAWEQAASSGSLVVVGSGGRRLGSLPADLRDPVRNLLDLNGGGIEMVAVPDRLHDALLAPLVRSELRCSLVVRDATRLRVAPVYLKAWLKGRGRLQVVQSARLLAVATNPVNPTGPDADPQEFRELVSGAAELLPVHDVVLEANGSRRRRSRRRGP
jgi:hypothetical protein